MKSVLFKYSVLVLIVFFITPITFSKNIEMSESTFHCKRFELNQKKEMLVRFNRGCMQCHHAEPVVSNRPLNTVHHNLLIDLHDVIKDGVR